MVSFRGVSFQVILGECFTERTRGSALYVTDQRPQLIWHVCRNPPARQLHVHRQRAPQLPCCPRLCCADPNRVNDEVWVQSVVNKIAVLKSNVAYG